MKPSEGLAAALGVSPLAVLVQGALQWALPPDTFGPLFAAHGGGPYDRELTLRSTSWLLVCVVSGGRPSVFAAFQADQAKEGPTIATSHQALYGQVGRTCPQLGEALLRHSASGLLPLPQAAKAQPTWRRHQARVWDGTDLDGSAHRLKARRRTKSAGRPGRLLAEYDRGGGLCTDAVACEGASAGEQALARRLLERACPGRLYLADRNFCSWGVLSGLHTRKARFVIREHQELRLSAPGEERHVGRAETGEAFEQQARVEGRHAGAGLALRRVILRRDEPTAGGDTEARLLTDLPEKADAVAIAELYRQRRALAGHFDFVKDQLKGEVESLGRPRAALLMMCLAMVAANAVAVVRQALRPSHGIELAGLSGLHLADELAGNYRAVDVLLKPEARAALAALAVPAFGAWCLEVAGQVRPRAFAKQPRGDKRPQPKRASGKGKPHYSTFRLLNEAKEHGC